MRRAFDGHGLQENAVFLKKCLETDPDDEPGRDEAERSETAVIFSAGTLCLSVQAHVFFSCD